MSLGLIQSITDGLLLGGVYACVAVGLSLSYGVMRIFNWANGEILMTAMYIAIFMIKGMGIDPYLTLLVTIPVMFIFGFVLCKGPFNMLFARETSREPISVLMFTAGIAYIIKNTVAYFFTTNAQAANTKYMLQTWKLGKVIISRPKAYAFLVGLAVILLLQYILTRTELGRALRCTTQDREAAQLMGMDIKNLYCLALGMGFACVGIAGTMLSPMYAVDPNTGGNYSLKCLVIVVLGGKGSVPGALLGGLIVGLMESIMTFSFSGLYGQAAIFAIFVLVLMFKPSGLLSKDRG